MSLKNASPHVFRSRAKDTSIRFSRPQGNQYNGQGWRLKLGSCMLRLLFLAFAACRHLSTGLLYPGSKADVPWQVTRASASRLAGLQASCSQTAPTLHFTAVGWHRYEILDVRIELLSYHHTPNEYLRNCGRKLCSVFGGRGGTHDMQVTALVRP